mmetsp:Transcript_18305/g.32240  ORF Transcript_18305/g.32240 Transcript_18305/m.32240 type:complete len:176 (+) Transcript_18305:165-692(+)
MMRQSSSSSPSPSSSQATLTSPRTSTGDLACSTDEHCHDRHNIFQTNDGMKPTQLQNQANQCSLSSSSSPPSSSPPERFLCPLSKQIMKNPVTTLQTQNLVSFERTAILKWLSQIDEVCPVTGEPLDKKRLIRNVQLQDEIEQWEREQQELTVKQPLPQQAQQQQQQQRRQRQRH